MDKLDYKETKGAPIDHYVFHVMDGKLEVTTYFTNKTTLKDTYNPSEIILDAGNDLLFLKNIDGVDGNDHQFSLSKIENYPGFLETNTCLDVKKTIKDIFGVDL